MLLNPKAWGSAGNKVELSLADIALNQFMTELNKSETYLDTTFILPDFNISKRTFSQTRHALTKYYKKVRLTIIESYIFLFANGTVWSVSDVNDVVV